MSTRSRSSALSFWEHLGHTIRLGERLRHFPAIPWFQLHSHPERPQLGDAGQRRLGNAQNGSGYTGQAMVRIVNVTATSAAAKLEVYNGSQKLGQ